MNRVITNMTNSLEKRVWGAWIAVLILALVFQGGMAAIDDTLGFRLPTYILVTVTSLVYGRAMYLWRTAHPQEHQQHQQHHQHHQHQQHQQSIAPEQAPPTQKEQDSNTGASNNVENPTDPAIGTHQHVDDRTTVTIPTQQQPRQRLYFLDNVKIFLTALVVTHHTECAFGGCGDGYYLVVGDYDCTFRQVIKTLNMLDQAFFMPLFFLISAYFTPRSYDRKGKDKFLFEKAKRIWIPAMLGSFFLIGPLSSMIGQAVANHDEPLRYIPLPGQGWFLFWLLLYNWVYSTIREAACRDVVNEDDNNGTVAPSPVSRTRPFPSYKERLLYGILVCGFLMMIVFIFLDFFFSMPIATGSLACSTLFWLSNKILGGEQLDTPPWALYLMVLLEGSALVALFQFLDEDNPDDPSQIGMGIFFFLIAGMYCIDVSLVILGFFQAHADVRTRLLKALAEAAYTVYIIHALVITSLTAAFVAVYNKLYDENPIEFEDDDSETSETKLGGPGDGSLHLFVGWIVVFVVTQLVVWPLSWWLRRLPGFKEVL